MAISGNRVWSDDGTVVTLDGAPFNDAEINAGTAPQAGSTATGNITYTFPTSRLLDSMSILVTQDGTKTTSYTVEYKVAGSSTWTAFDAAHRTRFSTGVADVPGEVYISQRVDAVRLQAAGAGARKVMFWHIYTVPEIHDLTRPGLYMSDVGASFIRYSESKMTLRSDVTRKKGQLFDNGSMRPGSSATGEFYIHNATDWSAVSPVLTASMVGVPDAEAHHVLFSVNGTEWRSQLTLGNIAPHGYSKKILFSDNAPVSAQQKFTSVKVVCSPTSWSGPGAQPVTSQSRMVATIHKTVSSGQAQRPSLWFAHPAGVTSQQPFTVYGRGLAGATWSYYVRNEGWKPLGAPTATGTTPHSPGSDGGQLVAGGESPSIDVEVESATFSAPVVPAGTASRYSIRAKLSSGNEDVLHTFQVNPQLTGDMALPPLVIRSSLIAAVRPAGLTEGGEIEQLSSRFSRPEVIVTGSDPRGVPDVLVNSKSGCELFLTNGVNDRLRNDINFETFGLSRWYPHSSFLISRPDLGSTRMHWLSMDRSRALSYESTMGIYLDPLTVMETSTRDKSIATPAMVFSPGGFARRLEAFADISLGTGISVPNFTMIAVVLLGPDPSPEYREVITGQPTRLASVPARVFRTIASPQNLPNVEVRYENRNVTGSAGTARGSISVPSTFLGSRPVIIGISVGRKSSKGRYVPTSWMTTASRRIERRSIAQKSFAKTVTGQIGSSLGGDSFQILEFMCGTQISQQQENQIINSLDSIYGVLD